MRWEIKSKTNVVKAVVDKIEYNDKWMEERYVTCTIESPAPIDFRIGDYLIYRNERFEINYDPGKIKSASRYKKGDAFKYDGIKLNSLADELTRCGFLDVVLGDNQLHFTGLPKFGFYGGVKDLAMRLQANLDRAYGKDTWSVIVDSEFSDTTEINISVDNITCNGALSILVNDLKTYYTIKDRVITIGAAGVPAGHLFKWGKGEGLYEIEQTAETDQQIVTRLRAYGSTRNIPHRYYNSLSGADGKKLIPDNMAVTHLMLPEFPYTTQDPYIDSKNIGELGVREDTIFFDGSDSELPEIYPTIEGMTAEQVIAAGVPCNATGELDVLVSAEQMTDNGVGKIEGDVMEGNATSKAEPATFKVTVKDLGFNINDRLTTQAATISFKSGKLGGRDFEIVKCTAIKDNNKVSGYELVLNRIYDKDIQLWFPYKDYNAASGDKFVLLNIKMPEVYIKAASQKLKEKAQEWLDKNDYSRSVYAPKIDELFMARQHDLAMASGGSIKSLHDTLCAGMQLLFEDDDLGIDAAIFIDSLTINEGDNPIPTYEVVLKEEKTVGTLQKMQNEIDSLAAGQGQGGGGYTAAQIRAFIDAYGGQRFLSKITDDVAEGIIGFVKYLKSVGYTSGALGTGWWLGKDLQDAERSLLVVDKLYVRYKAIFDALEIKHIKHVGGSLVLSPAGVDIVSVDEEQVNYAGTTVVLRDAAGSRLYDSAGNALAAVSSWKKAWRCRFRASDGSQSVVNEFAVGDMARCRTFNIAAGRDRYYWRKVVSVGDDYVDLAVDDCDPGCVNDVPQAGDAIVTFGNDRDPARRNAIEITAYDTDAPAIRLYTGIKTYSTAGTQKIVISPHGSKFTGDLVVLTEGREVPLAQFLADAISFNVLAPEQKLLADDFMYQIPPDDDGSGGEYLLRIPVDALMNLPAGSRLAMEIDFDTRQNLHGGIGVTLSVNQNAELYYKDYPDEDFTSDVVTLRGEFPLPKTLSEIIAEYGEGNPELYINISSTNAEEFVVNDWRIYSLPLVGSLKETGIDIQAGKITLKGDTEIITNDGQSAALFRDGKIKAELVEATEVTAVRLETIPDKPGGAHTHIESGRQEYYDASGDLKLLVHSGSVSPQNTGDAVFPVYLSESTDVPYGETTAMVTVTNGYPIEELYRTDLSGLHPYVTVSVSRTLGIDWPAGLPLAEVHFQAVLEAGGPVYEDGSMPGRVLWEADVVQQDYTGAQILVLSAPALPSSVWLHLPETINGDPVEPPFRIVIYASVRIRADYPDGWTLVCNSDVPELPLMPTRRFSEVAGDGAALRAGDYALRITADGGIEASSDAGSTWTTIFR